MAEVRSNAIQFSFKQTWFGIVLMVRTAECSDSPGMFEWSNWRKAAHYELDEYLKIKESK